MMQHEFEALAGYEVSQEDYDNIIEPMYTAVELSKQEFVKCIDKKRFAIPSKAQKKSQLLRQMKKLAQHLYDICGHYSDHQAETELEQLAHQYAKEVHGLDWSKDIEVYAIFNRGYEYPDIKRGCTYPREFVVGRGMNEYERIQLVKED